jgi:tetratricopeptide (TPR) repeat protein
MNPIFQPHECLTEEAIKKYAKDQLSGTERFRAENHLLDCPLCADAAEGYSLMDADAKKRQGAPLRILSARFLSAAAAGLILVVASVWFFTKPAAPERLFAAYYAPYASDLDIQLRNAGDQAALADTPLTLGLKAYSEKDFSKAASQLEAFLQENPGHRITQYYLGHALLSEHRWEEALSYLEAVWAAGMEYSEEANWYAALLYVKTGQVEKAKSALEVLQSSGKGRYYEQARELAGKLQ